MYKNHFIRIFVAFYFTFTALNIWSQDTDHWYNIISTDDSCKYFVPTSDIGSDWINPDFDDEAWIMDQSGIGYADGDDNTILEKGSIYSVYIRYTFDIADIDSVNQLVLDMDYDDGFVAYLNGIEIASANISKPYRWNMELETDHEALLYRDRNPERWTIDSLVIEEALRDGENLLAVEVHNISPNSSDFSSNTFLHINFAQAQNEYRDVMEWFFEQATEPFDPPDPTYPDTLFSHLPIITINTNGLSIPDEPKITAEMGIIFTEGDTSSQYDLPNDFFGKIGIERRGQTSSNFPKRPYALETRTDSGTNLNVPLLGMPAENDWILYNPYSDKTLMKNVLTFNLSRMMGQYAPRTRFVEVVLNGEYQGVYVLMEKIKEDVNRVNIARLRPEDISGNELTGGYIIRNDKTGGLSSEEYWDSPIQHPYGRLSQFQFYDPQFSDLLPEQKSYIKDFMKLYEETLVASNFKDSINGFRKYSNIFSFIDMMFINEITMNVDCYHFSTYFFKDKDSDGGKLHSGPVWDYNLAWGNVDYGNVEADDGFIYTRGGRMYYWKRMMEDSWYSNVAYNRWDEFRSTFLSEESIEQMIDSCVALLGPAVDRNFGRWPILGTYFWPNTKWPRTYAEEIVMLKTFMLDRMPWLDSQWSGKGTPYTDYPPHITCKEDQYLPTDLQSGYIPSGDELKPDFIWDDFDIESLTNDFNDKRSLEGQYIPNGTEITWIATDSRGQENSCSFSVFVSPDYVFEKQNDAFRIQMYPNPASDYFIIESNFAMSEIAIHTLDGKLVKRIELNDMMQETVNTNSFLSGMYMISVSGENGIKAHKLQLISK